MDMQQVDMFRSPNSVLESTIAISEASTLLNVSESSIRNWIKSGYLISHNGKSVTKTSLDSFYCDVVGTKKLNKRANKQFLDSHDHSGLTKKILQAMDSTEDADTLSAQYENGLSSAHKNKEGIYYTPKPICRKIFADIPPPKATDRFLDPCCGTGNFLITAIEHGFAPENVYGFDTDALAVKIAKKRLYKKTGFLSQNIYAEDYLDRSIDRRNLTPYFSVIATNPPWGKKIPKELREKYGTILGAGGSRDSCVLFMLASLKALEAGGILALLLPESFFTVASFQQARAKLLHYKMLSTRDFDKPFKGLVTKAQSFCIVKSTPDESPIICATPRGAFVREQASFSANPFSIINFGTSQAEQDLIEQIYAKPHITLKDRAGWGLGIVTGNNKKFCIGGAAEGYMPVYKGSDIHKGYALPPKTFIPKDLSLYQQVAPKSLYESDSKILYRFISSQLVFFHDRNQSYFLNSVNMLLPDRTIFDYDNLVALFNSNLYNWLFAKLFNTHKILRSDLECLPIPLDFLSCGKHFSELELLDYYGIEGGDNGTFRSKR